MADGTAVVVALVDAINRGDWDAAFADTAPEFEYDLTRTDSPLAGVYGREEMRGLIADFLGSWESARYEPSEFIEAGDRIVVPFKTHFRGRQGIEITLEAVWLWTFRDERLVRLTLFQERAEALEAAGISE